MRKPTVREWNAFEAIKESKQLINDAQAKLKTEKKTIDKMRKNQINQDIYNLGRLIRKAKPEKMTIMETGEIKNAMDRLKQSCRVIKIHRRKRKWILKNYWRGATIHCLP